LHEQFRAGRERSAALLAAPTIDRAAVEQHRTAQAKLMDAMSQRRTKAMLDSAEVLSPEQRSKWAEKAKHHRAK
jgi:Spy/CpxP family protein refolding chaperone